MPPPEPSAAYAGLTGNEPGNGGGAASRADAVAKRETDPGTINCDICIIGAGSGGLSVAAAAAAFGQQVVLVEKHKMGGDCLNYGCVPSKALIAAARRAHIIRSSAPFGIEPTEPRVDFQALNDHVQGVIDAIEPNDSVERFTGLGVRVITAAGRFVDKATVAAGDYRIKARRFVVATGSTPLVPDIPGLSGVPYFTNETIFDFSERIEHLIVIGAGPIGLELAQAYRRLGSKVTVLEAATALAHDDPEMTRIVVGRLRDEGVDIREGARVEEVGTRFRNVVVAVKNGETTDYVEGSHLLVAVGRKPNVSSASLEAASIKYTDRGIKVNRGLVTSNRRVYAVGDVVAGSPQFTHIANYHAGIVVKKALFRLPAKVEPQTVPWITFTDPELAHVGLTEEQAARKYGRVSVLRWPYHENDRAQAERATIGHVKVVVERSGRILGASIVGESAGELIQMWSLAISQRMSIKAMTGWISPYPTLSEINKRAAYKFFARVPSSPLLRKVIRVLAKLG